LLQQDRSMPHVVGIGVRMGCQNFSDAHGQTARPALGFGGGVGLSALFHARGESLSGFSNFVTGILIG